MAVSQATGHIYVVWTNFGVPGVNNGDPDIYLIKSTNGGTSWNAPIRVNDDLVGNGANQWFPWMTIDTETDDISIGFCDGRNHIGTTTAEITVAHSSDGGSTFENFVVSDAAFTVGPLPGLSSNYNGDYIGIAGRGSKVYPTWNSQVPSVNSQGWVSPFAYILSVSVEQRRGDNSLLSGTSVGRWEGGPNFRGYTVPIDRFDFAIGSTEVLQGQQTTVAGPTEKYHRWIQNSTDEDSVHNHHIFSISQDLANLTSRFKPTDGTMRIKADLIDAPGSIGGSVEFKDPWFIDSPDPSYGNNLRNQGMSAPFKTRSSPFYPDLTSPYDGSLTYKGVFLGQSGPPAWSPHHYSVGAPSPQLVGGRIAYFNKWIVETGLRPSGS
jgi:hypothetical protein